MLNLKQSLIPFILLILFLTIQPSLSDDPLFHFCFGKQNYTAGGPYEANLAVALNDLSVKTPPTGFGLSGSGAGPEGAFALALCRGDVSSPNCGSCVVDAGKELRRRCPAQKGAVIWYDHCLVKYSDEHFFGKIDNNNRFYMWNVIKVDDPPSFNVMIKALLTDLAGKAYANTEKLYASGEQELAKDKKLYGMVQCTRDLDPAGCKKCLDGAINELINCCDGKRGGRVVGPNCNFRYELYPFLDA